MRLTAEDKESIRRNVERDLKESTSSPKAHENSLLIMNNLMSLAVYWGIAIAFAHFIKPVLAISAHANNLLYALFFCMVMIPICLGFGFLGLRQTERNLLLSVLLPSVVFLLSIVIHSWFTHINSSADAIQSFGVEIRQFFIFYTETINPVLSFVADASLSNGAQSQIFGLVVTLSYVLPLFALLGGVQLRKKWLPQEKEIAEVDENNWILLGLGTNEKIARSILMLIALSTVSLVIAAAMMGPL